MIYSLERNFKRRNRLLIAFLICIIFFLSHIFGLFTHPFEIDFSSNFSYPLDIENLNQVIHQFRMKRNLNKLPKPINKFDMRFLILNEDKCKLNNKTLRTSNEIDLLIVVKSALEHRQRRNGIRQTWGFEERFSDVVIKTIFILGSCHERYDIINCQDQIDDESQLHHDIVQADFTDSYYNNTIKIMMAFKWAVMNCPQAQHILFVDDDYYVSIKNLLKYIRSFSDSNNEVLTSDFSSNDDSDFDGRLYTGFVFPTSTPMRHKISKWFVSLDEYPYSHYPPYVTAGAFLLSNKSLSDMYFASLYTKLFKLDDIYIGILAKKVSIKPIHNNNFIFWQSKLPSYDNEKFSNVIASHGFDNTEFLIKTWNQQKTLGNA